MESSKTTGSAPIIAGYEPLDCPGFETWKLPFRLDDTLAGAAAPAKVWAVTLRQPPPFTDWADLAGIRGCNRRQ